MKTFFKWFGGFFEDKTEKASRKGAVCYWLMGLVTYMVVKHGGSTSANMEMFWGLLGAVLLILGFALAEWFSKKTLSYNDENGK